MRKKSKGTPFSKSMKLEYKKYLTQKKYEKSTLYSIMIEQGIRRVENLNTGHIAFKAKYKNISKSFLTLQSAQLALKLMKENIIVFKPKKHKSYKEKRIYLYERTLKTA